jgi:hypothetical protein
MGIHDDGGVGHLCSEAYENVRPASAYIVSNKLKEIRKIMEPA